MLPSQFEAMNYTASLQNSDWENVLSFHVNFDFSTEILKALRAYTLKCKLNSGLMFFCLSSLNF